MYILLGLVHYKTVDHFLFIYDVGKRESFEKIKSSYYKIQSFLKKKMSSILVGLSLGENPANVKSFYPLY